ncbi:MAG TPA: hypothetical protein VIH21_10460 [Dehalococcoidia bacterium]
MTNDWPDDEQDEDEIAPGDADYDLSEAHGYRWEPEREHWPVAPWTIAVVSVLVIAALVLPAIIIVLRYR